jgi:hypothetical protein
VSNPFWWRVITINVGWFMGCTWISHNKWYKITV